VSDNRDRLIDDIAQAILDGTPIDWPEIDGAADETHRELIGELRLLSAVAELHRSDPDQPAAVTGQSLGSPGKMWGQLELLERIGGGTFGEVYRAWDTRLDREVAVKLLPADRADDPPRRVDHP
jgi:serine/threonine protein kinase